VLASASPYRRQLLTRLGLQFECADPGLHESPLPGESAVATAERLALLKAHAVAPRFPGALIIGSDQVASCDGIRLGKPGNHQAAVRQLTGLSGRQADFHTAVCVLDSSDGRVHCRAVPCRVTFRRLTREQIEAYLRREQPYDCAGSAKSEGLGIALVERIETHDPTSLVGLPLIALTDLLADAGLPVVG